MTERGAESKAEVAQDRLFVPLKTEHYRNFESGEKDIELRGYNNQFNTETVVPGRLVELRRGYSTDDSLWGTIEHVWSEGSLEVFARNFDHQRVLPDSTEEEFLQSARDLLGDYNCYIAFSVDLNIHRCPSCFRHLEETDGDPVDAYGKTYCRFCGSSLFDTVRDQGVTRGE